MGEEQYTIKEAAAVLGVSTDTIRRRIRSGRIKADKRSGPYGYIYYIPASELFPAHQVVDVVKVERTLTRHDLESSIGKALEPYFIQQEQKDRARDEKIEELTKEVKELKELLQQDRRAWWKWKFWRKK